MRTLVTVSISLVGFVSNSVKGCMKNNGLSRNATT